MRVGVCVCVCVCEQTEIPELETAASERTRAFVSWLQESRGFCAAFYVLKYDCSLSFSILCSSVLCASSISSAFYSHTLVLSPPVVVFV